MISALPARVDCHPENHRWTCERNCSALLAVADCAAAAAAGNSAAG